LKEYDLNTYGGYLVALVKLSGMTQIEFYTKANIKRPYFYDIVNGKVNPPPRERQYDIAKILIATKKVSQEEIIKLFELAAVERDEIPADIYKYLSDERRADIRKNKEYKTVLLDMIGG
jgi:predicted transcriptional regulator